MRVLLVEDDPRLSDLIRHGLVEHAFRVDIARDGERGLQLAQKSAYDVIVLDLLLPGLDGMSLLSGLRRSGSSTPVLVISAKDGVHDRVHALDEGADDFLVKPFSLNELVARVRAILRRPPSIVGPVLALADLELDLRSRQVVRAGKAIPLTTKEFALLEYLLRNRGAVVTRTMIAENVWHQHFDSFSNVIDVYIRYLRAKVDDGYEAKLIHTVRGIGYVLSERAA